MLKTAFIVSTILLAAPAAPQFSNADPVGADPIVLNLPQADTVVAQFSYLEISHGIDGFDFSVTDKTAVFVDFEFPGDLHIRIGF